MPEYTGTLLVDQLGVDIERAKEGDHRNGDWIRKELGKFKEGDKLKWLDGFGYRSNYAMVMLHSRAEELGLLQPSARPDVAGRPSISDLEHVAKRISIGTEENFTKRKDGYEGLLAVYPGLNGARRKSVTHERKFEELQSGDIDVTDAFTTDPELYQEDSPYVRLVDDRRFFIDYYAAPLARRAMLRA